MSHQPIAAVVQQHVDEAAMLRNTRSYLIAAPHVRLYELGRLDERLVAHLDGVAVAGEYGSKLATAALANLGAGEMFTAGVQAIENRDAVGLENLLALAEASPRGRSGLISAFGWVSAASLRGITKSLLGSKRAFRRQVGLAACAMHRVDPGVAVDQGLEEADPALRARALRVAADRGRADLLSACIDAMADADPCCAYESARAAVLLGDRRASLAALRAGALASGPWRARSLGLVLKLYAPAEASAILKALSQDPATPRLLMQGVGMAGNPHYIPWLVAQMQDPKMARLAGESFSLITGLNLSSLDFERAAPASLEAGTGEDTDQDNVSMDEDDGLPWPDPDKVAAWWQAHGHGFAPGTRYFMGAPPSSPSYCRSVLKSGSQRQRIAAAEYLCLLTPGTPLFNTAAPAWRQQRWLDEMGA
jgi:uncharacterized protein (TIGR02270 family)